MLRPAPCVPARQYFYLLTTRSLFAKSLTFQLSFCSAPLPLQRLRGELYTLELTTVEALFGLLYPDPQLQAPTESLMEVAALLGVPSSAVVAEGAFGVCLNRKLIDKRNQKGVIATTVDRSVWLAMTGEIEGLQQLVHELERAGHPTIATTDADVLLQLFLIYGAAFVARVQGFFNIVIWDSRRRRLLLYADRCGQVRALYYHQGPHSFVFGSCAKAVIAHRHVSRDVDPTALDEVIALAHPIAPRTLFAGVSVLTAGTFLEYQDRVVRVHRYWTRRPYQPSKEDLETLGESYFNALNAAIQRSVDTTAETGVLLSGGIDSAALVGLLHRAGHRRLKTFSIHIGSPEQSDLEASRFIASRYQTDHRSIEGLHEDCLEQFPEMIWHFERPGFNFHPTYLLCQEVRKYCDLVISGYGNDLIWGILTPLHPVELWLARVTPALSILRYLHSRRGMRRRALRKLRVNGARTDLGLLRGIIRSAQRTRHPLTDHICLDESLFGDQRVFYEIGKFVVDAHDLWIRLPYCDSVVVKMAETVPPSSRYGKGPTANHKLKSFFKDLLSARQVLPPEVIYRPKTWMHSPTSDWLRNMLGQKVEAIVLSRQAHNRGYFDMRHVARLVSQHRAAVSDHTYPLMMLTAIELWHRIFIDPPVIARPCLDLSGFGHDS